jgi:DNA-binding IclR family transcriptional regulator
VASKVSYNVRALDRAIRILDMLAEGKTLKLNQISQQLGMSTSTTYRILETLTDHQYVAHNERKRGYSLGIRCLELASEYYANNDIRQIALPELVFLRDETRETVHMGILDHMWVVYLEKLQGLHAVGIMSSRIGSRSPAYCTAIGKALIAYKDVEAVRSYYQQAGLKVFTPNTLKTVEELLAELERVREQGFALDLEEHEPDVLCIGAPIFNGQGNVCAAISISGPANRLGKLKEDRKLIDCTLEAARRISRKLKNRINDGMVFPD